MTSALLLDPPASPIAAQSPVRAGALVVGQSNAGFFIGSDPYGLGNLGDGLAAAWGVPRGYWDFSPDFRGLDGWGLVQGALDQVWTAYGGTPLWDEGGSGAFLADDGSHPSTWQPGYVGAGVRNFVLNRLTAEQRAQIPFIFWLHTESDTQVRTPAQREKYKAAVARWCQLLRSWAGRTAAQLPVLTALPMPFGPGTAAAHAMVRAVFHEHATDPAMNFRIALRNTADCEPRGGTDASHVDGPDLLTWSRRLSLAGGRWYAALYGHRAATAFGGVGPRIVHAHAETATTTLVTARHDRGAALRFRGGGKGADGRGWSVMDDGAPRAVTGAAVASADTIRLTHAACSGAAAARTVGYCLYGERLGRDGAVYDDASAAAPPPGMSGDYALDLPLAGSLLPLAASATAFGGGAGYSIALSPRNPGDVPRGADGLAGWTTAVSTTGGDSVEWAVFTASNQARSGWNALAGTGAAGGAVLRVPFAAGGDYAQFRQPGNDAVRVFTGPVNVVAQPAPWTAAARGQAAASATLGERPAGRWIELAPWNPGTLAETAPGAGAPWQVRVNASGVARIGYAVVKPDFSWRSAHAEADVGPNGSVLVEPRFFGTGDFLKVFDAADFSLAVDSGPATVASGTGTGGGAGARALAMRPNQPGTVHEQAAGAGAPFTFFIDSSGIARVGWVVARSSDFGWRSAVNVIENPGPTAQATARIVETGDFIKVMDADDPAFSVDSGLATVALDTAGGAVVDPADVAFAQSFLKGLTIGADMERAWAWDPPGGAALAAAYLRSKGFTYVRLFYAWRPAQAMLGPGSDAPPSKAAFARVLDAAAAYMAAGLKVVLDCCDVLEGWNDFANAEAAVYRHVRNCAQWIAERGFDRTRFAVGPVNEWAGDWDYTVHQVALHGILRAALPGYVLVCGSNGWKHYSRLIAAPPFTRDGRVLWDFHSYDAKSAAEWAVVAGQIAAWAQAHGGLACVWSEAGLGYAGWRENGVYRVGQEESPRAWAANLGAMFPAMNRFRPGVWAFTYGSAWRVNKHDGTMELRDGTGGDDDADLAAALPALAASVAAALADTGGAPGDPGDGVVIPPLPALAGLFGGPDPFDVLAKIVLRPAVVNAQANFQALGAFAAGAQEALKDLAVELVALDNAFRARAAELEAVNGQQAAMIAALQQVNEAQAGQIAAILGVNAAQGGRIDALQGEIDAAEAVNATQAGQITALQGVNATQTDRLNALEQRLANAGIA